MVLVIDNYDSFTYNLVQHLETLGASCDVILNDACDVGGIAARMPQGIVISPGPCTPDEAGVSLGAVMRLSGSVPILGVCLGSVSFIILGLNLSYPSLIACAALLALATLCAGAPSSRGSGAPRRTHSSSTAMSAASSLPSGGIASSRSP